MGWVGSGRTKWTQGQLWLNNELSQNCFSRDSTSTELAYVIKRARDGLRLQERANIIFLKNSTKLSSSSAWGTATGNMHGSPRLYLQGWTTVTLLHVTSRASYSSV